jgi:hypothetical protein
MDDIAIQGYKKEVKKRMREVGILTLIRMTKDEKGLAFFKGLLL